MGNIVYNTTYEALIETIHHYYGSTQSHGWQQIVENGGFTHENIIDTINKMPNHHAIQNADGTVRMTIETSSVSSTTNITNTASQINSNAQTGVATSGKVATIEAPAQSTYNATTGKFEATKGLGGTTQFITKSVVPAVLATGVGISLGKTIDSALYNANPDFWDSHGMGNLDPSTWASITSDMSDSTGEALLATAFNMLFGIDPNTGRVQAYADSTAVAYMALYMQQQGLFDLSGSLSDADIAFSTPVTRYKSVSFTKTQGQNVTVHTYSANYSDIEICAYYDGSRHTIMFCSKTPHSDGITQTITSGGSSSQLTLAVTTSRVYNSRQMYIAKTDISQYTYVTSESFSYSNSQNNNSDKLAYLVLYGTFTGGVYGTGNQDNATLPQLSNDMTVADVLSALQTQYPDLFNNAVTNTVAQPDGSTKTYTYIPVAYPQATSATDTHPTGDGQQSSQAKPYYDPDGANSFDYVWDILDLFDSDFPEDTTDYREGGDGNTPTPIMPTGSASALWKIYNPSQSQLDAFGSWLWSSDFVDQLKKLFNDPMQAIIGLHKVFVNPPVSGSGAIKVGYLTSSASANYVSGQYVDVDCGTVDLLEFFGNVFDYIGTTIRLYLPFIGVVDLDINDVMRGTIGVKYHVDVLTGACLAEVSVTRDLMGGILYTYSGNCAVQYPISSGSYVGIITGLLGIAGGVAGTIATGGALAPALMGLGASVGSMHTDVKHSGNISSNAGAMGVKKPYLIIERTQAKMPTNGEVIEGLPQNKKVALGNIHGYVKVKKAHYDGLPCTKNEIDIIKGYLENGVYIT